MKVNFIRHLYLFVIAALLIIALVSPTQNARAAGLCYVNASASGADSGASWTDAYTDLQSALADSCTEIWVAAGTYKPDASNRSVSFALENGTSVYGGFAGTETLLAQRDPSANVTILSGDLNGDDSGFANNGENSYHVVIGSGADSTAVLDGFTISGGNANGGYPDNIGGGLYNNLGSPTLANLIFSGNSVSFGGGGGMHNYGSSPTLTNVTFSGNSASLGYGGGMYNVSSSPTLTNVTFSGNSATNGGGMYNYYSSHPTLTNVTFSGNSASGGGGIFNYVSSPALTNVTFSGNIATNGGGMHNYGGNSTLTNVTFSVNSAINGGGLYNNASSPTLINVILSNSTSGGDCFNDSSTLNANSKNNLIEDASNACGLINGVNGNIIGSDPMLDSLANNGGSTATFALWPGSPAIDAGDDTSCPADDQRGATRPQGTHCDIGAYENDTPYLQLSNTLFDFGNQPVGTTSAAETVTVTNIGGAPLAIGPLIISGDFAMSNNTCYLAPLDFNQTCAFDVTFSPLSVGPQNESVTIPSNASTSPDSVALSGTGVEAVTATFYSIGGFDGTFIETNENSGIGTVPNIPGTLLSVGDTALTDRQTLAIVHFDTSSLPDNAVVTGVTLLLKRSSFLGVNPFTTHGDLLVDIASPFFGPEIFLKPGDFEAAASAASVGIFNPVPQPGNWYEAALNTPAFAHLNLFGSTQLRVRFSLDDNDDMGADLVRFFSGNHVMPSYRPTLIVEYYVP